MLETRFSHIVAFSDLLRGLLNEKRLIEVDYTKDCIDVYRDIVKYSLRITKDYRILAYAEANSSMDRFCSEALLIILSSMSVKFSMCLTLYPE